MQRWWRRGSHPVGGWSPAGPTLGTVAVGLLLLVGAAGAASVDHSIPSRLSDREFWRLVTETSEPGGYFPSNNLVSNELTYQRVIPELQRRWIRGQAYLGVGPDQNFTYLAALEPSIAFIVDIRRDNLRVQLMYKALVELSTTRAEFLSRLLSREVPAGLADEVSPDVLFAAFHRSEASDELLTQTQAAVEAHLTGHHGFALTADDVAMMHFVLSEFRHAGALLAYGNIGRMGRYPSYQELMEATDGQGQQRSYLASETLYGRVRSMQLRNLVIPVVGDFATAGEAGALRRVGDFLNAHDAVIGVIYTSNVEQYLFQYGIWRGYYANVATLPLAPNSTFVRSCFNVCQTVRGSRSVQLLDPVVALLNDVKAGRVRSYYDVVGRPQ